MPAGEMIARAIFGIVLGFLFGWGHLFLLRQALEGSQHLYSDRARRHILGGMPIRILLWVPAALLAVYGGLATCVGLLVGMIASRWLCWHNLILPR